MRPQYEQGLRRRLIAYSHRRKVLRDHRTVASVAVSDQIVWFFIPREGICDVTRDPLRRWIGRYVQRYQSPSFVPEDDQDEKQPKADRRHDQEVHRADA